MSLCTLTQSFDQPLPSYHVSHQSGGTHISGSTTLHTDPPKFAILAPKAHYIDQGKRAVGGAYRILDSEYLPLPEAAMTHLSEGDVARAAAMYFIHPINQAVSASPVFRDHVECLSESTQLGVRSDIIFNRHRRGHDVRCFAAVEFKKRGTISDLDFTDACKTIDRRDPRRSIDRFVEQAYTLKGRSFFQGNSTKLMKQAAAYATRHRTQYVALFNWDFLVLARFSKMDPRLDQDTLVANGVGDYCEISILSSNRHGHVMRAALLGFLAQANDETPLD